LTIAVSRRHGWRPITIEELGGVETARGDVSEVPRARLGACDLLVRTRTRFGDWVVVGDVDLPTRIDVETFLDGNGSVNPQRWSSRGDVTAITELPGDCVFVFEPPATFGPRGSVLDKIRGVEEIVDLSGAVDLAEEHRAAVDRAVGHRREGDGVERRGTRIVIALVAATLVVGVGTWWAVRRRQTGARGAK
jgi:hypothetical protein